MEDSILDEDDCDDHVSLLANSYRIMEESSEETRRKKIRSAVVMVLVIVTMTLESEVTQYVLDERASSIYFLSWLATSLAVVSLPIWMLVHWIKKVLFRVADDNCDLSSFSAVLEEVKRVDGLSLKRLALLSVGFASLGNLGLYVYLAGLSMTSAASAVTLYNVQCIFTFVGSVLFLSQRVEYWKVLGTTLAFGGAVFVALGDSSGGGASAMPSSESSHSIEGDVLSLAGGVIFSMLMIAYKRFLGDACTTTVCLMMSMNGLVALLFWWWLIPLFDATGFEVFAAPSSASSALLFVAAILIAFFINFLLAIGVAFTDPLYLTVGTMLALPATALADFLIHSIAFTWIKAVGTALVMAGFLLLNIDVHALIAPRCFAQQSSLPLQSEYLVS
jgi:drug/metabolite transporter (DMT)-like permease